MNSVLQNSARALAVLVDPEKALIPTLAERVQRVQSLGLSVDCVLLGGSTGSLVDTHVFAEGASLDLPVYLFPGNATQLSPMADALLLPVVISGRNAETLIGRHVAAAPLIRSLQIPVIPMGYMLLDGGHVSSAARNSGTAPISQDDLSLIVNTAIAGQLVGMQCIYLEAGSGAAVPVCEEVIRAVRGAIDLPLIVGGGIRSLEAVKTAWQAGANMVVIGNGLEQ